MVLKGDTNIKYLQENGENLGCLGYTNGELGPVYGQWRNWNSEEIDQITDLITELKTNPNSRRMIVSAWNPSVLQTIQNHLRKM
jgi:thymidylate synthase